MHKLAGLDQKYVWHPFTQMRDWAKREPIVLARGKGAVLEDVRGKKYLDANASIWTNLHGHNHPKLDAALQLQLKKVAHTSALGFANEPAALLAERLVKSAKGLLKKVFFSDDGSTALEVALKMSYEFTRRTGRARKPKFLSLSGAYHGDTVGAVSVGHIDLFHKAYGGLLFKSDKVMSPYCYRCPFNRAKPERVDARVTRKCNWECVGKVEAKLKRRKYAAFVVEPRVQGAAGMIAHPEGWLKRVGEAVRASGAQLIADEVMTGFGRTGSMFACQKERVTLDFLCVAKGLTGGYLPMAATLTTREVFDAFLGEYEEFKTFFHGHSYTGNQLGAATALASLDILQSGESNKKRRALEKNLRDELQTLWPLSAVGDVRQEGLVAGVELVADWRTRKAFPLKAQAGIGVCEAMARRGVLTRPIGNVIPLLPPYCTTAVQLRKMVRALREAIVEVLGGAKV
jgi:adenosylmethionine-8-amino-7-oxononanoate aminotransferase